MIRVFKLFENISSLIEVIWEFSSNEIIWSLMQYEKANSPISQTLNGIPILIIDDSKNAFSPIFSSFEFGAKSILLSLKQSANAKSRISITFDVTKNLSIGVK